MIVFERNNFELEFHPDLKILEVRWIGVLAEEDLKIIIHKIVELANEYSAESILIDATYVETNKSTVLYEQRIRQNFQQKLMLPTVKKIARVLSGNTSYDESLTEYYSTLVQYNPASFEFRNFNHHYEAMDWITEE